MRLLNYKHELHQYASHIITIAYSGLFLVALVKLVSLCIATVYCFSHCVNHCFEVAIEGCAEAAVLVPFTDARVSH
jgi:hypothetical protein